MVNPLRLSVVSLKNGKEKFLNQERVSKPFTAIPFLQGGAKILKEFLRGGLKSEVNGQMDYKRQTLNLICL